MIVRPFWNISFASFIAALVVYAFFGSPTPDGFGVAEGVIAMLLFFSVRWNIVAARIQNFSGIIFLVGLIIPSFLAFAAGHAGGAYARDVIAFGFIFLPLFYGDIVYDMREKFFWILALIGTAFALRTLIPYADILFEPARWGHGPPADLLYLANSPEVLFAALYGMYLIVESCAGCKGYRTFFVGCFLVAVTGWAMAMMMQRAGLIFTLFYALMGLALLICRKPARGILALMGGVGILCAISDSPNFLYIVGESLWQKTVMVGANGRLAEWTAVIEQVSASLPALLGGYGWGARFENPAVGGLPVNYTHALVTFLLLKTGLCGVLGILGAIMHMLKEGDKKPRIFHQSYLLLAFLLPFFIAVFLYASYKSLGFGLVLCGIALIMRQSGEENIRKLEKNALSVS